MTRPEAPATFYTADAYRSEESIGYLMKRVMMSIVFQADKHLEPHGLTSAQWGPLMRLKTTGRSTVAELARWCNVDAGAMTRLLDRLEKKCLCVRVRSKEDRRVVQVELTPQGDSALDEVPKVLCDVLNAHLAGFSEAEWKALKGYLMRMLETGESLRDTAQEQDGQDRQDKQHEQHEQHEQDQEARTR